MAFIYVIKNDINDKVYVGKTTISVQKRFKQHIQESKRERSKDRPLYRAMNKHGIDHFYVQCLEECDSSVLADRERFWVSEYQSYHYGYNATSGGDGKILYDKQTFIEDYNCGMTIKQIKKKYKCDTTTVSKYLHEAGIDVTKNQFDNLKIGVHMIDKNGTVVKEFDSHMDATNWILQNGYSNANNVNGVHVNICRASSGKRNSVYGFFWQRVVK